MTQAADLLVPTHFDAPVEHGSNYSGDTQTRCSRGIPRLERAELAADLYVDEVDPPELSAR